MLGPSGDLLYDGELTPYYRDAGDPNTADLGIIMKLPNLMPFGSCPFGARSQNPF